MSFSRKGCKRNFYNNSRLQNTLRHDSSRPTY